MIDLNWARVVTPPEKSNSFLNLLSTTAIKLVNCIPTKEASVSSDCTNRPLMSSKNDCHHHLQPICFWVE